MDRGYLRKLILHRAGSLYKRNERTRSNKLRVKPIVRAPNVGTRRKNQARLVGVAALIAVGFALIVSRGCESRGRNGGHISKCNRIFTVQHGAFENIVLDRYRSRRWRWSGSDLVGGE